MRHCIGLRSELKAIGLSDILRPRWFWNPIPTTGVKPGLLKARADLLRHQGKPSCPLSAPMLKSDLWEPLALGRQHKGRSFANARSAAGAYLSSREPEALRVISRASRMSEAQFKPISSTRSFACNSLKPASLVKRWTSESALSFSGVIRVNSVPNLPELSNTTFVPSWFLTYVIE